MSRRRDINLFRRDSTRIKWLAQNGLNLQLINQQWGGVSSRKSEGIISIYSLGCSFYSFQLHCFDLLAKALCGCYPSLDMVHIITCTPAKLKISANSGEGNRLAYVASSTWKIFLDMLLELFLLMCNHLSLYRLLPGYFLVSDIDVKERGQLRPFTDVHGRLVKLFLRLCGLLGCIS